MFSHYIEWHMREIWRELIFADEDMEVIVIAIPSSPPEIQNRKSLPQNLSVVHSFHTRFTNFRPLCATPSRRASDTKARIAGTPCLTEAVTPSFHIDRLWVADYTDVSLETVKRRRPDYGLAVNTRSRPA
jgi:hypothetical protein